ncbi:hypothetical protein [uncultured Croceitalea sp.]|uniref:hypothetical protein n=1 Tax=uncultured Croceitalea sp. TaxID=1798908 RepID=UPI0033055D9C
MKVINYLLFTSLLVLSSTSFSQAVYNGSSKHTFTTNHGTIDIGPFNSGWAHIYSDRPKFIFNRPVWIQGGVLSTYSGANLMLRTNDVTRMTILNTNGNVGIGINNPSSRLEVAGEIKVNNPDTRGSAFLKIDRGTQGKDAAVVSFGQNNNYTWHTGLLYNGGALSPDFHISQKNFIRNGSGIIEHYPELTIKVNGNVGIGTRSPDSKLTVKGNIHAEEVKVDLNVPGPDYVFKEGYDLITLEEVQNHIKAKGHLPNIPSAAEMETNGIDLGEMNMKLLEKIEELTLYILQQNAQITAQSEQIQQLKFQNAMITDLKKELSRLHQTIEKIKD